MAIVIKKQEHPSPPSALLHGPPVVRSSFPTECGTASPRKRMNCGKHEVGGRGLRCKTGSRPNRS